MLQKHIMIATLKADLLFLLARGCYRHRRGRPDVPPRAGISESIASIRCDMHLRREQRASRRGVPPHGQSLRLAYMDYDTTRDTKHPSYEM